jgi:hypothetical protein
MLGPLVKGLLGDGPSEGLADVCGVVVISAPGGEVFVVVGLGLVVGSVLV